MEVAQAEAEEEEDGADADGGTQFEGLSYDQLLELGDRIGDVAKERWAKQSAQFIKSLPLYVHCVEVGRAVSRPELPLSSTVTCLGDSADRCTRPHSRGHR